MVRFNMFVCDDFDILFWISTSSVPLSSVDSDKYNLELQNQIFTYMEKFSKGVKSFVITKFITS